MTAYSKLYSLMLETNKYSKYLNPEFYEMYKKSISNIYDHSAMLYVKFLGMADPEKIPSDAVVIAQIKKEILRLESLRDNYALQDNVEAFRKKNICDFLVSLFKPLV